ncbi:SH3 domain-containing protein [Roseomonas xinghualingensis]|uniref:SH3 domain-containing protein n=1 Tax=Roseomonas xinghualingensis TaxID=2986475 RepID=UPI0021F1C067|nr:SH3 domain-containing protein [Roseomonas sp. SXEYE001]MCV4209462.1 SH3 domain-containing protein [Roseomonas sp. SXEYE001]
MLATLAVAACDDAETKRRRQQAEQAARSAADAATVIRAAEERLRATARNITPGARFRGVIAHRQALGGYAVCGQVNLTGAAEDPYLPFVSIVSPNGERIDQFVASSSAEATRTYVEATTRCYDGGGPSSARSVVPLPPVPDTSASAPAPAPPRTPAGALSTAESAPRPALPMPTTESMPAQGAVTTTSAHPVNLRSSPAGGGTVLRVLPRGTRLRVFAEAPGEWYQVGEVEPIGWIHGSMLER